MKIKVFIIFIFLLVLGLFSGLILGKINNSDNISQISANSPVLSMNTEAKPVPASKISTPIRLIIPSLNLDSEIESVGKDDKGRMATPSKDDNVAWWKLGALPGMVGNSVIAGHYDKKDGGPAVFYDLNKLNIGDKLQIIDKDSNKYVFKVVKKEVYKDADFPLNLVFGETTSNNLNLITCDGIFDKENKNYSDRLVVFTTLEK